MGFLKKTDQTEKTEQAEQAEKTEQAEEMAQTEKTKQTEQAAKQTVKQAKQTERTAQAEEMAQTERTAQAEQMAQTERTAQTEEMAQTERTAQAEQIAQTAQAEQAERRKKRRLRMLPIIAMAVLAVLGLFGTMAFYRYLDAILFQERNTHFVEMSDAVTEVVSASVKHYRITAASAEYILSRNRAPSVDDLPARLEEIRTCLEMEDGIMLAFDSDAHFYASDGTVSNWRDAAVLSNGEEVQELMTTLDYLGDNATYLLFLRKLDIPLDAGERSITHMGVAVNVSVFQKDFESEVFQHRDHVYVVSPDGHRLFRHACAEDFIDTYNILAALEPVSFIHGGTLEELRQRIYDRESAGFEIEYNGEPYFVAASPVAGTDWAVLTFVPTEVLGAGTSAFLNTAAGYVSAIAVMVVLMMGLLMFFLFAKKNDRRLIEHQRQVNALLKDAADAAQAASAAKTDFLSHMSHDIRTPINGIMGMTDIALKNIGNPDKVLDCLHKIDGSSHHLLSLVNDVLDMSRIESGKTKISHEPIDIRQVAENCASIVGGQLQGRDVELVEEFGQISHPHVLGDELHLRQVLINILGNAVKFTPDGGKIYFRMKELSAEDGEAQFCLEVEDTGIGMKQEFLPQIFEAFSQEDGGSRTSYKGTGLGMAITKQFVDLMDGTIEVESELNVGSRFIIKLPAEIDQEFQEIRAAEQSRQDLAGLRLLLVEDNELNMEIAQYILEEEGVETVPAANGQEAVDAFAASQPGAFDGILMDVMMPVMDGMTATRAIRALEREDAKTVPIIAMTANAYDEDRRRCLEAGMNAHVAKPIDPDALMRVLGHYIKPNRLAEIKGDETS